MTLLPAEARLFFLAIKPRDDRDDDAIAALVNSPLDWKLVAALAERERLLSIVWYRVREVATTLPPDFTAALRRRSAVIEFQMAATAELLDRVVARLASAGIPSLLLKGAALAHSIYPSFALRPMNDLDILVPAELAPSAWALMRDDGWGLEQADGAEFHADFHHLKPLVDPAGAGIVLEIHRTMMPHPGPFKLEDASIWAESRDIPTGSATARIPSELHQLLHLCVHFAWSHSLDHGLGRTVRDVATLTAMHKIDWDAFTSLAIGARSATCAYWTLAMSRTLASAPVPDDVLSALRPHQPRTVTRALERAYIMSGVFGLNPSVLLTQTLWSAGVQPRRSGHGTQRPWQVTERFREVFHEKQKPGVVARIGTHVRGIGSWIRFVRLIGGDAEALVAPRGRV
jgi:hypothetical protein